jgi:predicted dehydrogenase
MAVDAPGVRSILHSAASAERQGVSLVSGFCWRYSLPERETYRRINDGAIGDVVSIHTTYHTAPIWTKPRQPEWTELEFQLRNWPHFVWLGGDHIVEQACHSIDKINWGMGGRQPMSATALGGRLMREGEASGNVYDHFTVIYHYEDGERCFHTCRQMPNCSNDNSDYLLGTKGRAVVNGWGPTHTISGERSWTYDGPRPNMYQVEHDELFASIRSGQPINNGGDMAQSTMMAIMGRMAAYSGQTITWNEAMTSTQTLGPKSLDEADYQPAPVAKPGQYIIT